MFGSNPRLHQHHVAAVVDGLHHPAEPPAALPLRPLRQELGPPAGSVRQAAGPAVPSPRRPGRLHPGPLRRLGQCRLPTSGDHTAGHHPSMPAISNERSRPALPAEPGAASGRVATRVGNLVEDPILRFPPSGAALASVRVAVNDRYRDSATGEWWDTDPTFLTVTAWRGLAENLAESLRRGDQVVVTGRLRQRQYETEAGEKRTAYQVEANASGRGPGLRHRPSGQGCPAPRAAPGSPPGVTQHGDPGVRRGRGTAGGSPVRACRRVAGAGPGAGPGSQRRAPWPARRRSAHSRGRALRTPPPGPGVDLE